MESWTACAISRRPATTSSSARATGNLHVAARYGPLTCLLFAPYMQLAATVQSLPCVHFKPHNSNNTLM